MIYFVSKKKKKNKKTDYWEVAKIIYHRNKMVSSFKRPMHRYHSPILVSHPTKESQRIFIKPF